MLQSDNLALSLQGPEGPEQHASCAVPTCCRRDRGGERPSPGYCPAWCCDRGSGPSAAPLLVAAGSAAAAGAASQTVAGTLQGKLKDILTTHMGYVCGSMAIRVSSAGSVHGHVSSLCNLSSSLQREAVPLPSHSALALRSSAWLHIRYLDKDTTTHVKQNNKY